jgi:hypothetical protein
MEFLKLVDEIFGPPGGQVHCFRNHFGEQLLVPVELELSV